MAIGSGNPLEDAEIKQMLIDAKSKIGTKHDFQEWQTSFLKKFHVFLDTDGSDKAQKAYATFRKASKGLIKIVKQLQAHIDAGTISETRISVKGRNSMSELKVVLDKLVEGLQQILPTTNTEIQAFGFTKFHMAAVLVKDGFKEYAVMEYCRLLLKLLRVAALDKAAGSTILHQIDVFGNQFDVFCGVMASLHMLDLANLTTALLHADLHKESQKIQAETKKLKEEKDLAASSHHDQRSRAVETKQWKRPTDKKVEEEEDEDSFGADDEASSYETIGYEDAESISSYESIEEIETVSSYEDVVKDEESSYETIEIDVPSDYETVQEEILVSDYESDNGTENGTNDASRSVVTGDDNDGATSRSKSLANKKEDADCKKQEAAAKKKEAAAARARKKYELEEEPKVKPVPKKLPMDPRFANVEKEWKKEQEERKKNKGKNKNNKSKNKDQVDDDKGDNGKKQKDEEEDKSDNPDDDKADADDGRGAGGGKAPGDNNAATDKNNGASSNDKPKGPPKPDANTQPVQRIQWTPKDYYHAQNEKRDDCFNEWKKYKKEPGTTGRSVKSTLDDDDDISSKASSTKNKAAAEIEDDNKMIVVPASRPKKRVVHTEIVTTRKKIVEAHKETIRRKKDKRPPQVIRIRHTKQIVKKVHVKKDKPKPEPKKIRVKKEKKNIKQQ